jgi:hypothetical protein
MTSQKYILNRWNPTIRVVNGKPQEVLVKPYRHNGKIAYKYKVRPYKVNGSRRNDSAACTHSELIRTNFEVASEGIDLPPDTEIKETRQDKYYIQEKDKEAEQFIFYNHRTKQYKLVQKKDYLDEMGKLDHTHTPTQKQVDRMDGYESKDPAKIKRKI